MASSMDRRFTAVEVPQSEEPPIVIMNLVDAIVVVDVIVIVVDIVDGVVVVFSSPQFFDK